jgi:hypothetical protein
MQEGNYQNDLLNRQRQEYLDKKILFDGNYTDKRYRRTRYALQLLWRGDLRR